MIKPCVALLLLSTLLAGCAGDEARRFWFGLNDEERAQAVVNKLSPHCEAMGHQRGSKPWQQCMQEMYRLYAASQSQQTSSFADGLRAAGTILQGSASPSPSYQPSPVYTSPMPDLPKFKTQDQACMGVCMKTYGYGYCDSRCSY